MLLLEYNTNMPISMLDLRTYQTNKYVYEMGKIECSIQLRSYTFIY